MADDCFCVGCGAQQSAEDALEQALRQHAEWKRNAAAWESAWEGFAEAEGIAQVGADEVVEDERLTEWAGMAQVVCMLCWEKVRAELS